MPKLIAIDAGHGPNTAGKRTPYIASLGRTIKEFEFNNPTAKYLNEELKRCGFRTLVTYSEREDTPLRTRTNRANNAKADLFISIHFNAYKGVFNPNGPSGFSAHVYLGNSKTKSGQFARIALKHLAKGTPQKNRGIVEQNLHVVRETKMPAVLFECGFMDHPTEALLMINKSFQKEVACELAQAVCEFYGIKYVPEKTPVKFYRVVTGSFQKRENAVKRIEELKDKGFDSFLDFHNGFFRVVAGSFTVKENAAKRVQELKKKGFESFIL